MTDDEIKRMQKVIIPEGILEVIKGGGKSGAVQEIVKGLLEETVSITAQIAREKPEVRTGLLEGMEMHRREFGSVFDGGGAACKRIIRLNEIIQNEAAEPPQPDRPAPTNWGKEMLADLEDEGFN